MNHVPLPSLAAPARRALAAAGIVSLHDLAKFSQSEIAALHGIGPNALNLLLLSMEKAGMAFRSIPNPGDRPNSGGSRVD